MEVGSKVRSTIVTGLAGIVVDIPDPDHLVISIDDHEIAGHIDYWIDVSKQSSSPDGLFIF